MVAKRGKISARSRLRGKSRPRLEHAALRPAVGQPLAAARLTDRQRIGLLFQGACAMAHLGERGWTVRDWSSASVDGDALLSGLAAVPAAADALPQKLLIALLRELFQTEGAPAGRGQGRRVARSLLVLWQQSVKAIAPGQAVDDLLQKAPFLWEQEFSRARACLAARATENGNSRLRVLGPRHFSRAMRKGAQDLAQVAGRLSGTDAREIWRADAGGRSPLRLAEAGHWRAAARAWEAVLPETTEERVECARSLYAVGRFQDALETLKGLRRPSARILRLWCLYRLGKLGPAKRELGAVDRADLTPRQRMQLLAVALRVLENRGATKEADRWLAEGLREQDAAARNRAELLAALNAWDRGDLETMRSRLDRVAKALNGVGGGEDFDWRWHKAKGLEATARKDGVVAAGHFGEALRIARRRLTPFEAGALWNELAMGRALAGDLDGAERALLHTLRLHREVQGSRVTTSALFNLAEIRLRLGRLIGVLDILERATAEDRRARNWRSLAHDLELWVRYELVRGRAHAALVRAREAIDELADRGISWRSEELHVLAARALGWLGRSEEAAAELESASMETAGELEPEEVPALWALAGDREAALAAAPDGSLRRLWSMVLTGTDPSADDWRALEEVEPYRAGRFVFDVELVAPGTSPPAILRRAVVALREAGAGPLAERLDARDATAWRALGAYLAGRRTTAEELDRLFVDAGYPEVRLLFRRPTGDQVLREGRGGVNEISRSLARGDLVLQAPFIDEVQKTLLAILAESLEPHSLALEAEGVAEGDSQRAGAPSSQSAIVSQSAAVFDVLERAGLLAASEVPIMILGETGTGKELLAKEVHAKSRHSDGPFVVLNCAAVAEELLASDFFGHVKGSFTGAARDRAGIFETARGGTVFLDEIGDLPLGAQGFLLRVLQEGEVRRVGESLPRKVEVRVVAATHRDLEGMVEEGSFRADLYFRLRVGALELPPLRDRGEDVLILAEHFLHRDPVSRVLGLSEAARRLLLDCDWPGNVRELKNVLSVAAALAAGGEVLPEHLDLPYRPARAGTTPDIGYHELVLNYRRRLVRDALRSANGNRAEAARRLVINRQLLSYLVRTLELDP
ncbi:MAG: hypothetical protein GY769_13440 [bacterium]|nr:hypothetical protein [bacterium]